MDKLSLLFNHKAIRFINHTKTPTILQKINTPLADFAIDDAIATTVGTNNAPPTIRFWVHPNVVVLGILDGRLPYLQDGLDVLQHHNYHAVIRNSGGLAVLLNEGVLNMSMIIPGSQDISIHDGYDMMYELIQSLFQDYTNEIKAYEIIGSYCPGDYDLSINGIKFAGISQRRVRNGIAIQIYIDIEGSSFERASIVRDFYQAGKKDTETKYEYPDVNPNVMGSINELLQQNFTVQEVMQEIEAFFTERGIVIADDQITITEAELFEKRYEQMLRRNETIRSYNPK